AGKGAGVAGRVGGRGRDLVGAVGQGAGGDAVVARPVGHPAPHQDAVAVEVDGAPGLGGAGERGRAVARDVVGAGAAGVAGGGQVRRGRRPRGRGVDGDGQGAGRGTGVAGGVHGPGGDLVSPVAQVAAGDGPVAVGVGVGRAEDRGPVRVVERDVAACL